MFHFHAVTRLLGWAGTSRGRMDGEGKLRAGRLEAGRYGVLSARWWERLVVAGLGLIAQQNP